MQDLALPIDLDKLPKPFDTAMAQKKLADWRAQVTGAHAALAEMAARPDAEALMLAVFGNSPFLSACALKSPETLDLLMARGPDVAMAELVLDLRTILPTIDAQDPFMRALRQARTKVALITGLADISGAWSLEQVTTALSDFAELAVDHAVAHIAHGGSGRPSIIDALVGSPLL